MMIRRYGDVATTTTNTFLGGGLFLYLVAGGLAYLFLRQEKR